MQIITFSRKGSKKLPISDAYICSKVQLEFQPSLMEQIHLLCGAFDQLWLIFHLEECDLAMMIHVLTTSKIDYCNML